MNPQNRRVLYFAISIIVLFAGCSTPFQPDDHASPVTPAPVPKLTVPPTSAAGTPSVTQTKRVEYALRRSGTYEFTVHIGQRTRLLTLRVQRDGTMTTRATMETDNGTNAITATGPPASIRAQLLNTSMEPFIFNAIYRPVQAFDTNPAQRSMVITGRDEYAGIECYSYSIRSIPAYGGCYSPRLGLSPYTFYLVTGGSSIEITLMNTTNLSNPTTPTADLRLNPK